SWPEVNLGKPTLLAFLGYKVGMTHVFVVDDIPTSPTAGREVFVPVTVVETPPMVALAVRIYGRDVDRGLYTLGEAWVQPPRELEIERRISTLSVKSTEEALKKLEALLPKAVDVRLILASQPKLAGGLEKKKPDIIEVKVGGVSDISALFEYAVSKLGKEVRVSDVFSPGMPVDVIGVTKGKGFQGVVKRWGVKELPRWHKHRKGSRSGPGARFSAVGTWWEAPQPGQMGFHRRTEYNKRILAIGSNGYEITPAGGFLHYGLVESDYVVLAGSIAGAVKRPVVLRWPIRPPKWYLKFKLGQPKITYVSLESKQGA
ncbi:MAG: 50S ribosomal protein L3, partial [Acidilobaceae archaeon]